MKIKKVAQSAGLVATVVDNLESNSPTDGLSANQGRILNEKFETKIITGQENATNEFIDGKRVFVRRYAVGQMPNATTLDINSDIIFNKILIIRLEGVAIHREDGTALPLNFANPVENATGEMIGLRCVGTNIIRIYTGSDRSNYDGFVNLYYTLKEN